MLTRLCQGMHGRGRYMDRTIQQRHRRFPLPSFLLASVGVLCLFLGTSPVIAQKIYKSVDKDGNVTYSTTPSPDAVSTEEVSIKSGTSTPRTRQPATAPEVAEDKQSEAEPAKQAVTSKSEPVADTVDLSKHSLDELDNRCDVARERKIAPLRKEEIEKCKADKRNDPGWCERFFIDYGEGGRTVHGAMRPRMFDDLPECVDALNERNRRARSGNR